MSYMSKEDIEAARRDAIAAHEKIISLNAAIKKTQRVRTQAFRRFEVSGGKLADLARDLDISRAQATRIKKGER